MFCQTIFQIFNVELAFLALFVLHDINYVTSNNSIIEWRELHCEVTKGTHTIQDMISVSFLYLKACMLRLPQFRRSVA